MFDVFILDLAIVPFIFFYAWIKCLYVAIVQHVLPRRHLNPQGKYVLVTGAGAGFGRGLSIALDAAGWHVLAGARRQDSADQLQQHLSSRSTAFVLNITKNADVQKCVELVKSKVGNGGLHAVVNNAGVSGGNTVEDMLPLSEFDMVHSVNFFGQVRVSKAMREFIIDAKRNDPRYGRYINVTSIAGIFAPPQAAAYTSSKFALEAYSDVLRRELSAWHIPVVIVEPGFFQTKMVVHSKGQTDRILDNVTDEVAARWGEDYLNTGKYDLVVLTSENPRIAINDLVDAVTSVSPWRRYLPGLQASLLFYPLSLIPTSVQDVIAPVLCGLAKPNPIADNQPVNWIFYVSDVVTSTIVWFMMHVVHYSVDRGADESEKITVEKLQQRRKDSMSKQSSSSSTAATGKQRQANGSS